MARNQLVYTMQAARWRSVLGRNLPVMTPYESGLFRALAPDTAPQPDQLQDALLAVYAKFDLFDGTVHQKRRCTCIWTACWPPLPPRPCPPR